MAGNGKQGRKQATYLTLIDLFLELFAAFAPKRGERRPLDLRSLELAMPGLATFRAGCLAVYDRVTEPPRG